ncbi:MOXD1 [Branchiostoma lanceolatum]|uniref:MOXD1 protein n=1 Tax=Branchiostoma lanceolatum TaxID=7740 RepID=A0A8J9YQE5_BRALA|nr:MOXD1 [Branchiostoma lanceolatum]
MEKVSCTLILAAVFVLFGQLVCADDFTHHESLDEEGKFHLFWKFDDEKIEFEAQVQTTGWVGLGLSPNGGMPGSDIAIGWVKDGTAHLTDRYAEAQAQPPVDESQDWELVSGYENGTHTVLRFNRKLTTCDDRDRVINEDTLRVLWAWHDQDPEDVSGASGPAYHGTNRGARATLLLNRKVTETPTTGATYTLDLQMNNVAIPAHQDTTYWCRVFEMPTLASKHHIIKVEPIPTLGNEGLFHHVLIYKCKTNSNITIVPEEHPGHECQTPNMPSDWFGCYEGSIVASWAIGGGDFTYPEHVGYPIGDEEDSGYVLMEVHYDNPQMASGIFDSSGIRMTYTPELRENDAGTLEVGVMVNKFHVIPPRIMDFKTAGFCSPQCLSAFMEELGEPIKIIGLNLHAHLLGVKLNARLIHNGVETDIARDDNYDFNLQSQRMLKEEITVYPGDTLITECIYDSAHKDSVVYGGIGTPEEMCETFFLYYPKFNLSFCDSLPNVHHTLNFAGVQDFDFDENFDVQVTAPEHMVNMSYEEVMEAVPWTREKGRDFSEFLLNSTFYSYCSATHQSNVNTDALTGYDLPFPSGTRLPTEDICSSRTHFTHQEVLDEEGKFHLFWKFDDEKIEFEAQVQTTGWVGLGLSPNGGMPGSDIAIGWVKDGTAHLTDRYAEAKAQPPVDESQDWELVSGYENGTHTVLRFNRKLTTCDVRDRVINEDTLRVLWAWHDQDPEDESGVSGPAYHGTNRGARSTVLLSRKLTETPTTGTTYTFDMQMNNVSIPAHQDTTYWCRVFEMPTLASKHHIIKVAPITTPGNEALFHHVLIYECKANPNITILPEEHPGHECQTPNMPIDWFGCYEGTLVASWAIGGGDFAYPEHVGYPIGDGEDSGYVLMEVHYDNPQMASGIYDSSGIRMTYTPELRANDAGNLEVGVMVNKYHVVPPRTMDFTSAGFCSSQCLSAFIEELGEPIKIIGLTLHAHLLGVKLNARLIHNGVETDIARDDNYDFNLQSQRMLKEEVTVYPGDTLITECVYDSAHKDSVVYGGLGTPEEMCETFFLYYPKFNLGFCDSLPNVHHTLNFAGVQDFDFDENLDVHITAPEHMVNMSYEEVMEAVPWTREKGRDFSEHLLNSTFYSYCKASPKTNVDTTALTGYDLPFPRGTRLPTEDICSLIATPTPAPGDEPGPAGGSTALQAHRAAGYVLVTYLVVLVLTVWAE